MKKFCFYLFCSIVCVAVFAGCDKDDSSIKSAEEIAQGQDPDDGGGSDSGSGKTDKHYSFYISNAGASIDYESGTVTVYFTTEAKWKVSMDVSNFTSSASVSPSSGKGSGSVRVSYGEAKDHYKCNESIRLTFTYVDTEYKNGGTHSSSKEFTIRRYYDRIRP